MSVDTIASLMDLVTRRIGAPVGSSNATEEAGAFFRLDGFPVDFSVMIHDAPTANAPYSIQVTCFDDSHAKNAPWDGYLYDYEGSAEDFIALVQVYKGPSANWPL